MELPPCPSCTGPLWSTGVEILHHGGEPAQPGHVSELLRPFACRICRSTWLINQSGGVFSGGPEIVHAPLASLEEVAAAIARLGPWQRWSYYSECRVRGHRVIGTSSHSPYLYCTKCLTSFKGEVAENVPTEPTAIEEP